MLKFNKPRVWDPQMHQRTLDAATCQVPLLTGRQAGRGGADSEPGQTPVNVGPGTNGDLGIKHRTPNLPPDGVVVKRGEVGSDSSMPSSTPNQENSPSGKLMPRREDDRCLKEVLGRITLLKRCVQEIRGDFLLSIEKYRVSLDKHILSLPPQATRPRQQRVLSIPRNAFPKVAPLRAQIAALAPSFMTEVHAVIFDQILPRLKQSGTLRCAELETQLLGEIKLRRQLHNQLVELKGNIRVFVRVRPLLANELAAKIANCVSCDEEENLLVLQKGSATKQFQFDRIFNHHTDNNKMFGELHQLLISVLDGYNVCIFAYGVTGSGKTFTMEGIYERIGLDLFQQKTEREQTRTWAYDFHVSIFEIYNETIIDLLNLKNLNVGVKINPNNGLFHIPGLSQTHVTNPAEIRSLVAQGASNRSVSSTNCNEQSSRSHLVSIINVHITTPNGKEIQSKVYLVDLAGSERLDKSGAVGVVAKEAVFINKSLSALGDVINARFTKSPHVPYRNSTLTSALQETLCGDAKTLMVLQVSPSEVRISIPMYLNCRHSTMKPVILYNSDPV